MGADQIGFLTFLPVGAKAKALVKKRVAEFESVFDALTDEKLRAGDDDKANDAAYEKARKALDKLGVDTKYLADFQGFDNDEQLVDAVEEAIESLEGFDPVKLDYRDVASRRDKINGTEVVTAFAGGMSWGDEPEGGGYTVLKALEMTGLLGQLEQMIPGLNRRKR